MSDSDSEESSSNSVVASADLSGETKLKLAQFCDAVRAKEQWFFKILDKDKDLGTKWANEAGFLLEPGNQVSRPGGEDVPTIQAAIE